MVGLSGIVDLIDSPKSNSKKRTSLDSDNPESELFNKTYKRSPSILNKCLNFNYISYSSV